MSDALPVIEGHLAEGEGWVLSRAREPGTGASRLVVTLAVADLTVVRRWLAVAGSVAGEHLPEIVGAVDLAGGSIAVIWGRPAGLRLAELLRARGSLAAGEIITLLAPLASTLATWAARDLSPGPITADTVWFAADGRPLLVPVGCAEGRQDEAALVALATLGRSALDRGSSGADAVAAACGAALDGGLSADEFASALLRATWAMPIGAGTGAAPSSRPRRRSRVRPVLALVAVASAAVGIGTASARPDRSSAAVTVPPAAVVHRTVAAPPSWLEVMTRIERARARAYATGAVALLDDVYAPASRQGEADRRQLSRITAKGQHAVGLQAFVEAVRVMSATDSRATLLVTDALTAYDVIGRDGRVVRHGHGRPSRQWDVTLVRTSDGWRVESVRRTQS